MAWNKLYRRSLFQHLRYAPGKRYEDQFLLPHLLAQCKTIACLAAPGYRYVQRSGSIMAQGSSRTYLDRPEYLLDWCAYFTQKGDALRAEGLLNDAIQNLAEKQCFDLSTPAQQARYRAACRACADSYTALAAATGQEPAGSFEPGYAFDALVVEPMTSPWGLSIAERVEQFIYTGAPANISHRYVAGREIPRPFAE